MRNITFISLFFSIMIIFILSGCGLSGEKISLNGEPQDAVFYIRPGYTGGSDVITSFPVHITASGTEDNLPIVAYYVAKVNKIYSAQAIGKTCIKK